jgi:hypothetical protein
MIYLIIIAAILAVIAYKKGLFDTKHEANQPAPFTVKFPCKLNGRVDPPPQDIRIANREKQLAAGDPLGGGLDGGIYLAGAFAFDVDADGTMTGEFVLHGNQSQIRGYCAPNGNFAGSHEGGSFQGSIVESGVSGTVHEGGGREWVYGDMAGEYRG